MGQQIHWFPGHMSKALNEVENKVKIVDVVIELLDARAPISSINENLENVIKNKKVQAFFDGVKPVVIGLITATGLVLFAKALGYVNFEAFNINLKAVIIVLSLILFLLLHKIIFKKKMNNIIFIILASGLGILISIIL